MSIKQPQIDAILGQASEVFYPHGLKALEVQESPLTVEVSKMLLPVLGPPEVVETWLNKVSLSDVKGLSLLTAIHGVARIYHKLEPSSAMIALEHLRMFLVASKGMRNRPAAELDYYSAMVSGNIPASDYILRLTATNLGLVRVPKSDDLDSGSKASDLAPVATASPLPPPAGPPASPPAMPKVPTHYTKDSAKGDPRVYECFNCKEKILGYSNLTEHKKTCKAPPKEERIYPCFACKAPIKGITALYEHRKTCSTKAIPSASSDTHLLPEYVPKHNLDLSVLPDARFAVEVPGSDPVYLAVKRLKKRTYRNGRFAWTKFRYRGEYFEPGTIEVRLLRGDTRKLIGVQRPGEVYKGEHEDEFVTILKDPLAAMILFGRLVKKCSYCGRTLTDPLSQSRGIGPDCWEEKYLAYARRVVTS
jgi:hypothetical protein